MAHPKRKPSKSQSKKRRTHYVIVRPGLSLCPSCNELKAPHRACPSCGFYKGRTFKRTKEERGEKA
ncbi:MAG: 50S ribosomal protein L32 [Deltaproteobacteria bacterium]